MRKEYFGRVSMCELSFRNPPSMQVKQRRPFLCPADIAKPIDKRELEISVSLWLSSLCRFD